MNKPLIQQWWFWLTLFTIFVTACSTEVDNRTPQQHAAEYNINATNKLIYTKDERTNLCFASYGMSYHGAVLTQVPCTEEVEKLVVK